MAKNLEQEIIDFHSQQALIAEAHGVLDKMGDAIVKKYCPLKKGDKVIFTEWWSTREQPGIISAIEFKGINSDAISNRWVIRIIPTTKEFKEHKATRAYKYVGDRKGGTIRKHNEDTSKILR